MQIELAVKTVKGWWQIIFFRENWNWTWISDWAEWVVGMVPKEWELWFLFICLVCVVWGTLRRIFDKLGDHCLESKNPRVQKFGLRAHDIYEKLDAMVPSLFSDARDRALDEKVKDLHRQLEKRW